MSGGKALASEGSTAHVLIVTRLGSISEVEKRAKGMKVRKIRVEAIVPVYLLRQWVE